MSLGIGSRVSCNSPSRLEIFFAVLGLAIEADDFLHAEIAERGDVKNDGGLVLQEQAAQAAFKIIIGFEGKNFDRREGRRKSGCLAAKEDDLVPGPGEGLREERPEFAGGKIGQPPDVVDRLVAGA